MSKNDVKRTLHRYSLFKDKDNQGDPIAYNYTIRKLAVDGQVIEDQTIHTSILDVSPTDMPKHDKIANRIYHSIVG